MAQQHLFCLGLLCEVFRSYSDTPHSVGLLWTSDRPVRDTSAWQHTQNSQRQTSKHPGGIRTRNPSKRAAADSCHVLNIIIIIVIVVVYVAVPAQEIQGLTVGWGLQHHVTTSCYIIILHHVTSCYNIMLQHHVTSCYNIMLQHHITTPCYNIMLQHHVISCYIMLHHITTPCYNTMLQHHVTSCYNIILQHHVTSTYTKHVHLSL